MERYTGARAKLIFAPEATYGVPPASGYTRAYFAASDLDGERNLGYSPLLGQGRNRGDPYYERLSVLGGVDVPIDTDGFGSWLRGLFGPPITTLTAATGAITFSAQPAANSTITLGGTTWTFKSSGATGNQTNIGGSLAATLTQLASDLNASADAEVVKLTYAATATQLTMTHDTTGTAGNAFTLAAQAASNGIVSAPTLLGGGYAHAFTSGGTLPSHTIERELAGPTTATFRRFMGCKFDSLAFELGPTGPADARIAIIAQTQQDATASLDSTPDIPELRRFSRGDAAIQVAGQPLVNVMSGGLTFGNGLEPIVTVRPTDADGIKRIDGIDETEASATGTVVVRASDDPVLPTAENSQTPASMTYSLSHPTGRRVVFHMPRVWFPVVKKGLTGPGGIDLTYTWQAAHDESAGYLLRATLSNTVASYA